MADIIVSPALSGGEFLATGLSLSAYARVDLLISNLKISDNDKQAFIELRGAGGALTGAHVHYRIDESSSGADSATSSNDDFLSLTGTGAFDLQTADSISGKLEILRPTAAQDRLLFGQFGHGYASSNHGRVTVAGHITGVDAITGFRVFATSGSTIISGTVVLVGHQLNA